ncbi:MAG TPA: hypothetical protein VIJ47_01605 [Acidimicrobiales bacterium]
MLTMPAAVLAHQGGWDEMLMVLTPIAVFALLLMVANRRAKAAQAARNLAGQDLSSGDPAPERDATPE